MTTHLRKTTITEATIEIHGQTTLYDLRRFMDDTAAMVNASKVETYDSVRGKGLRIVHEVAG